VGSNASSVIAIPQFLEDTNRDACYGFSAYYKVFERRLSPQPRPQPSCAGSLDAFIAFSLLDYYCRSRINDFDNQTLLQVLSGVQ